MQATVFVTAAALVMFLFFGAMVSRARRAHGISAPAMTGHPAFERVYRVHQNTAEQLIVFLPALWMFAFLVSDLWAGIVGLVFIGARILYARNYYADASRRELPFVIGLAATLVLLVGAVIGALLSF